ncbi:thioredoxin family protein [Joostella sp. CR20]|uniref:thioredoxin family protein n=1 Tax=Joostella sp. CR20 TaxID=2804312 RepID=UPI00313A850C
MKFIISLFLTSVLLSTSADEAQWLTDFSKAKKEAKRQDKNIMMYFTGSDWCGPCIMLKQDLFDSEEFKELAKDYVLVKVDIPRRIDIISEEQMKKNRELLDDYNPQKVFPKIVFLNDRGKKIDQIEGYNSLRDPRNYFEMIKKHQ